MDRTYIDDHHVVARYLADRLSDEERRTFEAYMVANPSIVQDLEAAARLKVGLHTLQQTGELDSQKAVAWYHRSNSLALAASIAILVIGTLWWINRGTSKPPALLASSSEIGRQSGNPIPIPHTYSILRTRGAIYDIEIELPGPNQIVELRVLPEVEAHPPRYTVSVAHVRDDDSLKEMSHIVDLASNDDGFVVLYLNPSQFTPGRYQLTISGDPNTDAANAASKFKIRLKSPAK